MATSRTLPRSCASAACASRPTCRTTASARRSATPPRTTIPFTLIAGGEDAEAGAVSFRFRDGQQTNGVPVKEAVAHIVSVIDARINDPAGEKLHSD